MKCQFFFLWKVHPVYSLSLRFTGILHNPDFIHETLAAVVKDYATYK